MYFHPKLAWPPATYDVIARNHSNWPSLTCRCAWTLQLFSRIRRVFQLFFSWFKCIQRLSLSRNRDKRMATCKSLPSVRHFVFTAASEFVRPRDHNVLIWPLRQLNRDVTRIICFTYYAAAYILYKQLANTYTIFNYKNDDMMTSFNLKEGTGTILHLGSAIFK